MFFEGFRVNLKIFLSLTMPNQYCQTVVKEMWGWFWGDIFGQKTPISLLYSTTVLYDNADQPFWNYGSYCVCILYVCVCLCKNISTIVFDIKEY